MSSGSNVSQSCCEAQEGAQQRCGKRASHRPCSCSKQCIERLRRQDDQRYVLPPHTLHGYAIDGCTPHNTAMVFYLVGLGLGDERDITVRGLEAVKKCDQVWLEAYTSVLCVGVERLEAFYGRGSGASEKSWSRAATTCWSGARTGMWLCSSWVMSFVLLHILI